MSSSMHPVLHHALLILSFLTMILLPCFAALDANGTDPDQDLL